MSNHNPQMFIYISKHNGNSYVGYFPELVEHIQENTTLVHLPDDYKNSNIHREMVSLNEISTEVSDLVVDNIFSTDKTNLNFSQRMRIMSTMCRPSSEDPSKVAYYENYKKMKEGRLTRIKAGRFLRKLFSKEEMSDDHVELLANNWISEYGDMKIVILTKGSEIANAYMAGPSSCMSYSKSEFRCEPYHPTEVYGTDDEETIEVDTALAVLYTNYSNDEKRRIAARSLIIPAEKVHTCAYGDYQKMYVCLQSLGYRRDDDAFYGKRMRFLTADNGATVCPYLDMSGTVSIKGDHLIIGGGCCDANFTNGTSESSSYCEWCDDPISYGDENYYEGQCLCSICFEEEVFRCDVTGDLCRHDDGIEVMGTVYRASGERMWNSVFSERGISILLNESMIFRCDYDDEYYSIRRHGYIKTDDGMTYEKQNFDRYGGFYCSFNEKYYFDEDYVEIEKGDGTILNVKVDVTNNLFYKEWLSANNYIDPRVVDEAQVEEDADCEV